MKIFIKISLAAMIITFAAMAFAADSHWFDMENCSMCKPYLKHDQLMENTAWESYPLSNGVIMVTTVNEKFLNAYRHARSEMKIIGEQLMAGKDMQLCGSCQSLAGLFPKGVKAESIETSKGNIHIFTADKENVVAALHEWNTKNAEEMKKMEKMKAN